MRIRVAIDALGHAPDSTKTPAALGGDHLTGPGSHGIEGRSPANGKAEDVASNHANQLATDRVVLLTETAVVTSLESAVDRTPELKTRASVVDPYAGEIEYDSNRRGTQLLVMPGQLASFHPRWCTVSRYSGYEWVRRHNA